MCVLLSLVEQVLANPVRGGKGLTTTRWKHDQPGKGSLVALQDPVIHLLDRVQLMVVQLDPTLLLYDIDGSRIVVGSAPGTRPLWITILPVSASIPILNGFAKRDRLPTGEILDRFLRVTPTP